MNGTECGFLFGIRARADKDMQIARYALTVTSGLYLNPTTKSQMVNSRNLFGDDGSRENYDERAKSREMGN